MSPLIKEEAARKSPACDSHVPSSSDPCRTSFPSASPYTGFRIVAALLGSIVLAASSCLHGAPVAPETAGFIEKYCASCHDDVEAKAQPQVTSLAYEPDNPANFSLWVKIHDRVQAREMPPKKKKRPGAPVLEAFRKEM